LENSRQKMVKTRFHVCISRQLQGRAIDELDGDCTNVDDRMSENAAATMSCAGVNFDGFLNGMMGCGDKHRRLNEITCGGCAVSLGVRPVCSAFNLRCS